MTVKLNINAKNLNELGLELREKRTLPEGRSGLREKRTHTEGRSRLRERSGYPRKRKSSLSISNFRTPYNLNSFSRNIPTINSAIGLETLKAIENKNNNPHGRLASIDTDYLKSYIDRGLDDTYNRITQGASYIRNALMNEINTTRNMINNFQNQRTFTPTGNRNPPASQNRIIISNPEEQYQQVIDEVDPFLYEFNKREQIPTLDEIRANRGDTSPIPFNPYFGLTEEEIEQIENLQEELEDKALTQTFTEEEKGENLIDINYEYLRDDLSSKLENDEIKTLKELLYLFYQAYPDKNIIKTKGRLKIVEKDDNMPPNRDFNKRSFNRLKELILSINV